MKIPLSTGQNIGEAGEDADNEAALGGWRWPAARKQPWTWSLTMPTFCMNA